MKTNVYEMITEKLIKKMENPTEWKKPFYLRGAASAITKKNYRGVNQFILSIEAAYQGFSSPFWMTAKQANSLGAKIRKGEKSTQIIYYIIFYKDSLSGKTMTEEEYRKKYDRFPSEEEVVNAFPRYYNVFNLNQIEGLQDDFIQSLQVAKTMTKIQSAEEFLSSFSENITFNPAEGAFYNKIRDFVSLPPMQQFISESAFYSVAFHELIHWTGHESRLNRPSGNFGSDVYAVEELIAETGAAFLCQSHGFESDLDQHGAYLKSWADCLKKSPKELFSIVPKAQEAAEYLLQVAEKRKELQNC